MAKPVMQNVVEFQLDNSERTIVLSCHLAKMLREAGRCAVKQKVHLIKYLRDEYAISLKDAKDIVDYYFDN